ncbi:fasciclin domain-containing protein [Mucilaginibacter sp. HMF5004]|uniref:fasciclin domain-containing protein n=1 Tax=Mucilaginibacter rivuli TaxID=2857527 RepID=UPI001C5E73C7|nr:fasciclin domain-containing protein [Mucilaginibacter rivuli]MBW4888530.1 fasciclin domain-containing protein [Mucilaginibacter rivuli]
MIRIFYGTIFIFFIVFLTSSCKKKAFDDYFARPDSLAQPIYQQLQAKGRFTNILACIDKAGFKTTLGTAGFWTFFAPNDDAFKAYFQATGISGVAAMDSVTAASIVSFCLVQNSYRKDQLVQFQTSKGPTPNDSYRRKTAYYDFTYKDPSHSGVVVANNRNGNYVVNDNNNKYIPYFIDGYFNVQGLTATDYTSFFPGSTYTGFNVAGARVINADIPAENGIIHEIDKVITPIPNIEQYITNNPQYSEFRKLLDMVAIYSYNATLTRRYNILTGKSDSVFIKSYPTSLAFAPNNESYLNLTQTDAQELAWTIAIPTNTALLAWEKEILVNLGSFKNAPSSVLIDLINSFMWNTTVWPKDILTTKNFQVQSSSFASGDITDRQVLSNGNFYGTKLAHQANVFRSVYGKVYLDPKYSLMNRIFYESDLKISTSNPAFKYTVFMMSDAEVKNLGYNYDNDRIQWSYLDPATPTATPTLSLNQDRLTRIASISVVNTPNGEFDNLSGTGVGETFNGEYVKFINNKVYGSGNVVDGTSVSIDSSKLAYNGKVYYTKGLLHFAENSETMAKSIKRLGTSTDPATLARFSYFYQYLIGSASLYNVTVDGSGVVTSENIIGVPVGTFYTVFIPTNAAITQAVKDGLLPGNKTTGAPNFTNSTQTTAEQQAVANFILYHILNKNTVAQDGKKSGVYGTLLNDVSGNTKTVTVFYSNPADPNTMEVRDARYVSGQGSTVTLAGSNNLANRTLIHSINKVLNFN